MIMTNMIVIVTMMKRATFFRWRYCRMEIATFYRWQYCRMEIATFYRWQYCRMEIETFYRWQYCRMEIATFYRWLHYRKEYLTCSLLYMLCRAGWWLEELLYSQYEWNHGRRHPAQHGWLLFHAAVHIVPVLRLSAPLPDLNLAFQVCHVKGFAY